MLRRKSVRFNLIFVGIIASINANAAVIYNDLSDISARASNVQHTLADSFSTGSGSESLTDVKLLLGNTSYSTGSFTVSLFSDNNTAPGTLDAVLGTIQDNTLSNSFTIVDLAVSGIALSANTRYWIELTSSNSTALWAWANTSVSDVGTASEWYAESGYVYSNDSGPYQMQINVSDSVVPLPSTLALLAIGTVGLMRRKQHNDPVGLQP
jgi:hypothetical protein